MEDMKVLPDHEVLYLNVLASGHSFGASSYHVLTMCDGIRMQVLRLHDTMIEKTLLDNLGSEVKLCFIYLVLSLLKKNKRKCFGHGCSTHSTKSGHSFEIEYIYACR